jgi:hypothetical protein
LKYRSLYPPHPCRRSFFPPRKSDPKWRGLQPAGFEFFKHKTPQAKARAT